MRPPHVQFLADPGGGRGIRTPGDITATVVFKTTAFVLSAIPPGQDLPAINRVSINPTPNRCQIMRPSSHRIIHVDIQSRLVDLPSVFNRCDPRIGRPALHAPVGLSQPISNSSPKYGRNTSGNLMLPSALWLFSRSAIITRGKASPEPLSVCTYSGRAPSRGR